jgi:hypothetical protein
MADPGAPNAPQAVAQFPDPPRALYANIAHVVDLGTQRQLGDRAILASEEAKAPAPPAPPGAEESFNMFGRTYSTSDRQPSLPESGRACLYDETMPVSEELRRLNRILLTLFSSLVVSLSTAAGESGDIVGRIEDVFLNMRHLLNLMRPAQATRDIRRLLNRQAASRRRVVRALSQATERAEDAIADAAADLRDSVPEPDVLAAEGYALLIVNRQMAKSLSEVRVRKSDKLGWYRGSDENANLMAGEDMSKARDVSPNRNPHVIDIDSSMLAKFTRITNE